MNRMRKIVLVTVLMLGGLELVASGAYAQAPSVAATASTPPYYYGWGYNGWGYYYYPAAPVVPPNRGGFYSAPAQTSRRNTATNRYYRDYTGRHDGLARPWLQPLR